MDAEVEKDEEPAEVAPKKGRGRPKKEAPVEEDAGDESAEVEAAPAKKARGRPKKAQPQASSDSVEPKKGRGRPKKAASTDDE